MFRDLLEQPTCGVRTANGFLRGLTAHSTAKPAMHSTAELTVGPDVKTCKRTITVLEQELNMQCNTTAPYMYTAFQKKHPLILLAYKLRNSCLILIIFDTKIPHII